MTVTVMEREDLAGRGRERYMKGSKVTDTLAHTGHTRCRLVLALHPPGTRHQASE